jgi:nucleoside-diphosphate-sugar epimerase
LENLIVGKSSQISRFFSDENFKKIDSRNVDLDSLNKNWGTVVLALGENRKNIKDVTLYEKVNFNLTLKFTDFFSSRSERVVVFSSCELWNRFSGPVDLGVPFEYFETPYVLSKKKLSETLMDPTEYKNVDVVFPFNFNSTYRSEDFLFGKIFNSIINEVKIEIGDTYFYRDLIHPNFVVSKILEKKGHQVIGSGRLTFVNDFIRDLYEAFGLKYEEFVFEKMDRYIEHEKRYEYYYKSKERLYSYEQLLTDTINEIEKIKKWNQYSL